MNQQEGKTNTVDMRELKEGSKESQADMEELGGAYFTPMPQQQQRTVNTTVSPTFTRRS